MRLYAPLIWPTKPHGRALLRVQMTASGAHVQWQGTAFKYSERNVTNFEAAHNLDRNCFLKVKKEVPQDETKNTAVSAAAVQLARH
jgi:hypothetical protein